MPVNIEERVNAEERKWSLPWFSRIPLVWTTL